MTFEGKRYYATKLQTNWLREGMTLRSRGYGVTPPSSERFSPTIANPEKKTCSFGVAVLTARGRAVSPTPGALLQAVTTAAMVTGGGLR